MTGRYSGPWKGGAGLARKKVTAESLEGMGYRGFERLADETVREAFWVLDYIALAANHFPGKLRFENDAMNGARIVTYGEELADGRTLFATRRLRQEEARQPINGTGDDGLP